jgi:protease-4
MTARVLTTTTTILALILGSATLASAKPTTQPDVVPAPAPVKPEFTPTTAPADKPLPEPVTASDKEPAAVAKAPSTKPSTAPTTNPIAAATNKDKFPSPSELMARWKQNQAEEDKLTKVAYFDLNGTVTEKPKSEFSFFSQPGDDLSLRDLIGRMHKARDDKDIRAVLITVGADTSVNLAQAQEIRDVIKDLRSSGKKIFVYADAYDTPTYLIASAATNVCMMPGGEISIPGVGFETMFYKGIMDKVGVKADYIQIGEYKGAEEPYTRTGPSDELRGELNKLCDALYDQIVDMISLSRGLSREEVKRIIDDTMLNGKVAKERGLVDHLVDQDGLRDLLADELGNKVNLLHDYAGRKREEIDWSNPFAVFAAMAKKPAPSTRPSVALVYADGVIVDGEGGGGLFSQEENVGSETMRKAFRSAARDNNVKAIVIRINSPGGSALASEVMWQSVRRAAKDKPVIISVGGMAASGGYYLASAGDTIFADPSAIVGSIGVVGGKFVLAGLFEKLGLGTETFAKGRNAGLFSSNKEWDERQRRMVRNWMQETYDQFTQRVMSTRKNRISDIDKVARGRIFLASQAKQLGMIDEIGGVEQAISYAANKVNLKDGNYDVRVLPAPKTLADLLGGGGADAAAPIIQPKITIAPDSVLNLVDPQTRKLIGQQVQLIQLLQNKPICLMSPYVMTTK